MKTTTTPKVTMTTAQHTPGPWSIKCRKSAYGGADFFDGVIDAEGREIRVEGVTLTSGPTAQANARLIAAAPELLDALEWLVALLPDPKLDDDDVQREYVTAAIAAIAKATGGAA